MNNTIKNIIDLNILHKMKMDSIINDNKIMLSVLNEHEKFLLSPDGKIFKEKFLKNLRTKKIERIVK